MRLPQTTQHYTDHLVRLESFVREAFAQRQHAVGVFFDLEKAYESTWKFGIMRDLHNAGLRGRLPLFIESFLKNRQFHVRLGSSYSDLFDQGSILSDTLFGLKINSIVKAISPSVECSLYVDDFLICYWSKHIHIIERHLQHCLNKLADLRGHSKKICKVRFNIDVRKYFFFKSCYWQMEQPGSGHCRCT